MLYFLSSIIIFTVLYIFYKRNKELEKRLADLDLHLQMIKRRLEDGEKRPNETAGNNSNLSSDMEQNQKEAVKEIFDDKQKEKSEAQTPLSHPLAKEKREEKDVSKDFQKKLEPKRTSRTRTEWELLIGGKWLNWIGAVALFLGAAFFMKYAFDNNWINEITRVAIGAVFGVILLIIGGRFAKKGFPLFSQGIVGTGVAVLYTSVFASYNFYELVPQYAAIILMIFVTLLSFHQALAHQSLPIAVIGWIGAYGTPFLLPGEGSTIGLMSYLGFVTAGMLALIWKNQKWSILYYLSFGAAYLIFFGWSMETNGDEYTIFLLSLFFFWMIFYVFDLRFLFHEKASKYERIVSILNTLFLLLGFVWHFPHVENYPIWLSSGMLVIAILYLIPIVYFYYRKMLSQANTWQTARQSITFLLLTLAASAIYFQFQTFLFVVSIEIGAIVWWGWRYQIRYIERFGLGLISLSTLAILIYTTMEMDHQKPLFNWVLWNDITATIILMWIAHLYHQRNMFLRNSLHAAWSALLAVGVYAESELFFLHLYPREIYTKLGNWDYISHVNYITDLAVACCLLSYAVLLGWFGLKRQVNTVTSISNLLTAIMLLQIMLFGKTYLPLNSFTPVLNIRFLIFILAIGLIFGLNFLWNKLGKKHPWYKWLRLTTVLAIVVLLFELTTVEIMDGFTKQINLHQTTAKISAVPFYENLEFYTLVLVWMFSSVPMYILGVRLRYRLLIYLGFSTLGLGSIPILFHSVTFYSYDHFVPVINLRFLSLACVIGVFFFFYRNMRNNQITNPNHDFSYIRQALFLLGVLAVFLCVTMEISDAFEATVMKLSVQSEEVIRLRNLQQLSISIAWLLLSCLFLWIGIWRNKQSVRILSICIFGLSILKIFLFDLSFLTTLYRIFSFMGLGIILLAVSFIYQKYKHLFTRNEKKSL